MPDTRPFGAGSEPPPDTPATRHAEVARLARHARDVTAAAAAAVRRNVPDETAREAILYAIARSVAEEITGPGTWAYTHEPMVVAIADAGDRLLAEDLSQGHVRERPVRFADPTRRRDPNREADARRNGLT